MIIYGHTRILSIPFDEAVEKIKNTLVQAGFGILSEIDVQSKIKEKLGKDLDDYIILGACNPPLAYQALQVEYEIGLLLPCNVIVYKKGTEVYVSCILPSVAMSFVGNSKLEHIASSVEEKLKNIIDSL